MKFTLTINQAGATIAGLAGKLDIIDLAIFDAFKDFANGNRCEKKFEQNRVWFWISYQALVKEIPFVPIKTKDAVYRRMKKLAEVNIIEFHPGNQKTGKAFFAWSANYDHLNGRDFTEDELKMLRPKPTDEKPDPYGRASVPPTDEKPYNQYTKDQRTKPIEKDMSAQTADGLPEKPSLDANPSEIENTPIPKPPAKKVKPDPNECRKVAEPLLESIKQEGIRLLAENAAPEKLDRLRKKYQALEKDIRIEYDTDKAINLLNELVGTEYETETPAYRKLARLRFQKYSYAQMELVIRYKVREWKDNDKMRGYLRPSTLFNGSFAEYLEAAKLDKQSPLTPKDAPYKLEPAPERKPVAAYTP